MSKMSGRDYENRRTNFNSVICQNFIWKPNSYLVFFFFNKKKLFILITLVEFTQYTCYKYFKLYKKNVKKKLSMPK